MQDFCEKRGGHVDPRPQFTLKNCWKMFEDKSHQILNVGSLDNEFSATVKIPKIPRISNVLSRCKKMEERKVRLLMLILNFVPLTTIGPFY